MRAVAAIIVSAAAAAVLLGGFSAWVNAQSSPRPDIAASQVVPKTLGAVSSSVAAPPSKQTGPTATVPSSPPKQIVIPAIGVDAPVIPEGTDSTGALNTPPLENHNLAGWYNGGPEPGQVGASVIVGHVDSVTGPSVFYNLKLLKPGDKITVKLVDGAGLQFTVVGIEAVPKNQFPAQQIFGNPGYPALRLVTCGGAFDYSTGHYTENIIVFARGAANG